MTHPELIGHLAIAAQRLYSAAAEMDNASTRIMNQPESLTPADLRAIADRARKRLEAAGEALRVLEEME